MAEIARISLWQWALEDCVGSLELRSKIEARLDRALCRFGERPAQDGERNFNLGGLTKPDVNMIIEALLSHAVLRFMSVFGPMGDAGDGIAANDSYAVRTRRDGLLQEAAAGLGWPDDRRDALLDAVRRARNEHFAHESGKSFQDFQRISGPIPDAPGLARGSFRMVTYSRTPPLTHEQVCNLRLFAQACVSAIEDYLDRS